METVLDVGCGDGNFLSAFLRMGCEAYGTEFDVESKQVVAEKGVIILEGALKPVMPAHILGVDLIVFTEVIEHINNPKEVLTHFHTILNPGGLLFITTPNFNSLERYVLGSKWGMIMYPEHISYYTPRTLNLVASNCGFSAVEVFTENVSVYRVLQFFNLFRKGNELDAEAISANAQALISTNPLGAWGKKILNAGLRTGGLGSSLVAVYQKIDE